jgi:hypothetical protein
MSSTLECTRRGIHIAVSLCSDTRDAQTRTILHVSQHVLRQTGLRQRAATTGVNDSREASAHQRDRDLSHDVTPDPQTRADAMDVVAGAL